MFLYPQKDVRSLVERVCSELQLFVQSTAHFVAGMRFAVWLRYSSTINQPHYPWHGLPTHQAFDNARGKAGDVSELFDILKGKLRPDRKGAHVVPGVEGQTSSGHSTLQAHYRGSASNTVLSTANLQRIQTFLDEPQKHLGQVRTRT